MEVLKGFFISLLVILIPAFLYMEWESNKRINGWITYFDAHLEHLESTTLRKPSENYQGALLVLPNGSGYIPVLFKDETTYKGFAKTVWQWNDKGLPDGYYAIERLFVPKEK